MSVNRAPTPPVARKDPKTIVQLGRERTDPYAWMKDENWRAVLRDPSAIRPDIRAHLEAENAYTEAMLADTKDLQAALFAEMRGRIKEDDASVPAPDGPYAYAVRYEAGAQHPRHVRTPREGGAEEVLLDEEAEAKGKAFYAVNAAAHAPDHSLFAWAVDEQGSEVCRILVKDLTTGELTGEPVQSATGDFCFSPCSQHLFWVWRDEEGRPAKVFRRPARGGPDVLVYEEPDDGFFLGVGVVASDAFVVIGAGNQETSEAWLIPASDPTGAPVLMAPRETGVRYEVEHWRGQFVIRTNADGAVDWKLVTAPEASPGESIGAIGSPTNQGA